jgi:hypothetical protein
LGRVEMNRLINIVFMAVVVIVSVYFLFPMSLMLLLVLFFIIWTLLTDGVGGDQLSFFWYLIFSGYALYSLWWLVFSYKKMTLRKIPVRIWLGLFLGFLCTIFIFLKSSFEPSSKHDHSSEIFTVSLVFWFGPLLLVVVLLLKIYIQQCSNKSIQPTAVTSID